jgi:hypothetical protein
VTRNGTGRWSRKVFKPELIIKLMVYTALRPGPLETGQLEIRRVPLGLQEWNKATPVTVYY